MDEATCRSLLCFDISTAAGFHAQLAGILAGLAFTSIVLILQSSSLSGRGAEAGLLSFFSALITLLIAAFLYGTAAGEELVAGRVAIMVLLAGLASVIAVLELFYGLTWLVRAAGFVNATEMAARISSLVPPLITFAYLAITALDLVSITTGRAVVGSPIFVFVSLLSLLLVAVLLVVQLGWHAATLRRVATEWAFRLGPEPWLSLISIGVGLVAAGSGAVLLLLKPTIAAPAWLVYVVLTLWFGFECAVVLLIRAIDVESTASRSFVEDPGRELRLRSPAGRKP